MNIKKFIRDNYEKMTDTQIANELGVTVNSIRGQRRMMGLIKGQGKQIEILKPEESVAQDKVVTRLSNKTKDTDKKYRILLKENERYEKEMGALLAVHENFDTFKIKATKSVESEATAFLVASDWHIEEKVDKKTISGLNHYNLEIAKERSGAFFKNGLKLIKIFQKDIHIDTLVLPLLGDFISNHLHDELIEENLLLPTDATIYAQNLLASGIEYLLKDKSIKKIKVPCHSGNHGRTTKDRRNATENGHSLEYMMYCQLANHFRNEPRVEFLIAEGYHSYIDVYGYTVRFHHGHNMRYGGGIGGITIPVNKAIAQWDKLKQADLDVFGHFHQFMDGGKFISNGSMIGYNAFALSIKASYEPPKQAFFLVDKMHGKSIVTSVFFD